MSICYKHDMLGELRAVNTYSSHTDPSWYVGLATVLMFVIGLVLLVSVVREWRTKRRKLLCDWPKNSHGSRRAA